RRCRAPPPSRRSPCSTARSAAWRASAGPGARANPRAGGQADASRASVRARRALDEVEEPPDEAADRVVRRPARRGLGLALRRRGPVAAEPVGAAALARRGPDEEPLAAPPAEEARAPARRLVDRDGLDPGRLGERRAALAPERRDQEAAE